MIIIKSFNILIQWLYRVLSLLQNMAETTDPVNFINCLQLTCNFVPDELTAFYLADGREERPNFLLGHRLRKVIHNEVCLAFLLLASSIRLWRGIVWIWRRWGWRVGVHSAILLWHSVHAVLHHFIWQHSSKPITIKSLYQTIARQQQCTSLPAEESRIC